jgi:putative aminopeptidase FrvX
MNMDLLKALCETPGVPGHEYRVRDLITSEIKGLFDEVQVDAMGSLLCKRNAAKGKSPTKIMLLCHMDEIGFLVSHITEAGNIYLQAVGGFDPRNLFSRRVLICTDKGDIKAVMNPGGPPIHISSADQRKKVPEVSEFFVDTGLGKATKDHVKVGDMVVMDEPFIEIGDKVVSKALDNRIACWLGIEAIRGLKKAKSDCEIHVAFTTQEEVGLRGARTAAYPSGLTSASASTPRLPATHPASLNRIAPRFRARVSACISATVPLSLTGRWLPNLTPSPQRRKSRFSAPCCAPAGKMARPRNRPQQARAPLGLWSARAISTR